jgi:hypothetical protein
MTKKTRVNLTNLQNSQPGLWDCDTTYKANKNNNYEAQFSINPMLKEEIKKKKQKKTKKKKTRVNMANLQNLQSES